MNARTPNLIPSAADGSLIFSMYAPNTNVAVPAEGIWDLYGLTFEEFYTYGMNNDIVVTDGNITMPHRCADYNVTIQNANIKPTNHPTMLYPLLVNENKPIVGTIDYSDYQGDDLSYAMAYANKSEVDISIPNDVALNSQYIYNVDKESEYEYNDPRTIAKYTCNAKGVLPTFNSGYTDYRVSEMDNGDGTYTTSIIADDISNLPTTINFKGIKQLQKVYYLNTSAVTDMSFMFNGCSNLTYINADNLVHSGVTTLAYLFATCANLESIDVSSWDTSNMTNMNRLFASCFKLSSIIGVDKWDTSKVKDMSLAFSYIAIESLDVSNWKTSSVTTMSGMFQSCSSLTSLDVSGWDTSKVTDMSSMFQGCSKLESLPITTFGYGVNYNNCYRDNIKAIKNLPTLTIVGPCNLTRLFAECKSISKTVTFDWRTDEEVNVAGMFVDIPASTIESLYGVNLTSCGKTLFTGYFFGDIGGTTNNNFKNLTCTGVLSNSLNLTRIPNVSAESLDMLMDCLSSNGDGLTLTLGSTNLDKLTDDDKVTAINKGWTLA